MLSSQSQLGRPQLFFSKVDLEPPNSTESLRAVIGGWHCHLQEGLPASDENPFMEKVKKKERKKER